MSQSRPESRTCRRLFGVPPRSTKNLRGILEQIQQVAQDRWNFDFQRGKPMEGPINWVPVTPDSPKSFSREIITDLPDQSNGEASNPSGESEVSSIHTGNQDAWVRINCLQNQPGNKGLQNPTSFSSESALQGSLASAQISETVVSSESEASCFLSPGVDSNEHFCIETELDNSIVPLQNHVLDIEHDDGITLDEPQSCSETVQDIQNTGDCGSGNISIELGYYRRMGAAVQSFSGMDSGPTAGMDVRDLGYSESIEATRNSEEQAIRLCPSTETDVRHTVNPGWVDAASSSSMPAGEGQCCPERILEDTKPAENSLLVVRRASESSPKSSKHRIPDYFKAKKEKSVRKQQQQQ